MGIEIINKNPSLHYFLYEIVHHCNLNCKGCDHCAPIAEEEYVDLKQYKNDLKAIKKTFYNINIFAIMGGEPLLHPQLIEIVKLSRKILKNTIILIYTNGINLEKLPEEFWELCQKENIEIILTKYKIKLNLKNIYKLVKKYNVKFFIEKNKEKNFFHKIKFNFEGTEDAYRSHKNCFQGQVCHQVENGILYKCPIVPAARHFNKFFNENLPITEKDGLILNKRLKKEDIIEYFDNPIPFCRYCNMEDREENKIWELSKKEITEWT